MGATGVGALSGALDSGDAHEVARTGALDCDCLRRLRRFLDPVLVFAMVSLSVLLLVPVGFSMMTQMARRTH